MILFLAFVLVPIIEIAVIIKVGGLIGTWETVALIVLSAFVGTALVRMQGFQILARAQATMDRGGLPAREMFDGVCLLIAGVLLLTPGFVTDSFGIALLVPGLRTLIGRMIWRAIQRSGKTSFRVYGMGPGADPGPRPGPDRDPGGRDGDIIEGDYREVPEDPREIEPGKPTGSNHDPGNPDDGSGRPRR